jgi:cytochrome P450
MKFDDAFYQNPHKAYDKMRAHCPVYRVGSFIGPLPAWVITGHAEARAAMVHPGISKDVHRFYRTFGQVGEPSVIDQHIGSSVLGTDPPEHTRLRKLATNAFTSATTERLRPQVEAIVGGLLDAMEPHGRADLVESFAVPLPILVVSGLLGVSEEGRGQLRRFAEANFGDRDERDEGNREDSVRALSEYMASLVKAKRTDPADDLTSRLIAASDTAGQLSDSELVSLLVVLLLAGTDTTATWIGNAVHALLVNPGQLAALRKDMSLVPNAVDEVIRYECPQALATTRYTLEPVTIGGVAIPEHELVFVSLIAANRDPARFPKPRELDIHRDTSGHIGFGHGIHHCLGVQLARMETQIALAALLERFPRLRLDIKPKKVQWRRNNVIRGLESLPVRW